MNDLSTEVKANEVHENAVANFNIAGKFTYRFILDLKKMRDEKLYKKLNFNSFEDYCQESWGFTRRWVDMKIQSASMLSESDFENFSSHFGNKKTLLLATMEEEQREKATNEGVPTDSGYKSLDKATQKEISYYKSNSEEAEKRARQAEQQAEQAKKQAESERKERERLEEENENIEPEIKEIYIEDEERINNLTKEIEKINDQKEQMENRLKSSENDAEKYRKLQDDIDKLRNEKEDVIRQIDNVSSIGKFISRVERSFEEDLAPVKYSRAIEELERSEVAQESLETIVSKVEKWCNEMRTIMKNNNITEVIEHE